jgi:hypothetical protein
MFFSLFLTSLCEPPPQRLLFVSIFTDHATALELVKLERLETHPKLAGRDMRKVPK